MQGSSPGRKDALTSEVDLTILIRTGFAIGVKAGSLVALAV
jgi:hypothetical protein